MYYLAHNPKWTLQQEKRQPQVALCTGPSAQSGALVLLGAPCPLLQHRPPLRGQMWVIRLQGTRGASAVHWKCATKESCRAPHPVPNGAQGAFPGHHRKVVWLSGAWERTWITILRPVKFVLAGGHSTFSTFGLSQSQLPNIWNAGKVFLPNPEGKLSNTPHQSPTNPENSVTQPIKDPQTLSFLYLNFHNRTLGKPRKNVSPNAPERAKPI